MKKGQAALEFLTTYGWAFLVILVMIGALAYFGILSPSRFLPERCNVGPEFSCDEHQATESDSTVRIKFTNNVGQTISDVTVTRVAWAQEDFDPPVVTEGGGAIAVPAGVGQCNIVYNGDGVASSARAGDPIEIACEFTNAAGTAFPPVGAKVKFNIDVTYTPQGSSYPKPLTAEIYTALQP